MAPEASQSGRSGEKGLPDQRANLIVHASADGVAGTAVGTAVGFVRLAWIAEAPRADRLVAQWTRRSRVLTGDDTLESEDVGIADLMAADAEMRTSRGMDARLETYLAEWPPLADRTEACRAILMHEFARLEGGALAAAVERVVSGAPGLADEARGVATLCEVMGIGDDEPREGESLGKYRLVSRLGSGAFGSVWLAWDEELSRHVALKLLHSAAEAAGLRRVMAEAQAAAGLDHPNVVKIHAAGRLEGGRAFIDAQLVGDADPTPEAPSRVKVGVALDRAVKPAGDEVRWSARMMEAVARGVAAAHARGVIHRDIKPANVIVTPGGTPMLADFGLSALSAAGSGFGVGGGGAGSAAGSMSLGRVTGTPAFMSPEQARGERATPASDIYAMGATLRYLLTGELPVKPTGRHSTEARTDVLEQLKRGDVETLESRRGALPLTLVRICDRAMAAKPEDRYTSASAMAEDLSAWLNGRPTAAGREGAWRRARLWYARHAAVATITLAAVIVMVVGTERFIVGIQAQRDRAVAAEHAAKDGRIQAERQRDRALAAERDAEARRKEAERGRDIVSKVNLFMQETFTSAQADNGGRTISMYDAITRASSRVTAVVGDDELVEAAVRHVIGSVLYTMGEFRGAETNLKRSEELRLKILGAEHLDTLMTQFALAEMYSYAERNEDAARVVNSLLPRVVAQQGQTGPLTISVKQVLAQVKMAEGRGGEAKALLDEVLAVRRATEGGDGAKLSMCYAQLGQLAKMMGKREEAIGHFGEAVRLRSTELGDNDIHTISTMNDLGSVYAELGKVEEAEPLQRTAFAWFEKNLGLGHVGTLNSGHNVAWMLLTKKKAAAESLEISSRLAPAAEASLTATNPVSVRLRSLEGRALAALTRYAEAEAVLKGVVERAEKIGVEGLAIDAVASRTLAECCRKQGRDSEGDEWVKRADQKRAEARAAGG